MKKIIIILTILLPEILTAGNTLPVGKDSIESADGKRSGFDSTNLRLRKLLFSPFAPERTMFFVPTTTLNYVRTRTIMKGAVYSTGSLGSLVQKDVVETIVYSDDLGRAIQTVGVGQSGDLKDLVTHTGYNKRGLVDTTYLPYVSSSTNGTFRSAAMDDILSYYSATTTQPYAVSVYRSAPDARLITQGSTGTDWQPGQHAQTNSLTLNTSSYPVKYFKPDGTSTGNYLTNSVLVGRMFDENGNEVRTFTNLWGQKISKQVQSGTSTFLQTYYVYDEFGRLKYQMSPNTQYDSDPNMETDSQPQEFIYKYKYDGFGRVVEKKVPGAAAEYFIYDKLGRLVLTQDGNLRDANQWYFVKYDMLNRPVYTGIYTDVTRTTRTAIQAMVDSINYNVTPRGESEAVSATYHGYTNVSFPNTSIALLSVNYYDHYDFDRNSSDDYTYDNSHLSGIPSSRIKNTRGLTTGSKVLILGTSNWLINCVFYDTHDRPLQSISNNYQNLTAQDKVSYLYLDLASHIDKVKVTHTGSASVEHVQRYEYDANWRTTAIYHSIDGTTEQQVASYSYNKLGQLVDRKLHKTAGGTFMQSVDYRYHLHGWLSSINNATLTNDGLKNDDTGDYFGMELYFGETTSLNQTPQFNGNISGVQWKGIGSAPGNPDRRAYKYTYDKADRLKHSKFLKFDHDTWAWTLEVNTINETLSYDDNGNILALGRRQNKRGMSGLTVTSTSELIDSLTYTYSTGNQLSKVEDSGTGAGFLNGSVNGTDEYTYNSNGSLTADKNKGIDSIRYNELGKVRRIRYSDKRLQIYTYAATGQKLSIKTYSPAGILQQKIDYVNGFQYESGELRYEPSPEGRIVRAGLSGLSSTQSNCGSTTGFTASNSTISSLTKDGETYLKVVGTNIGLVGPGAYIASGKTITAGKRYLLKVKGYVQSLSTYQPTLYISANTGSILWSATGPLLPKGSANEGWISYEFTAPVGSTSIDLAVRWWDGNSIPNGTEFYLNSVDFKELTNEYQYSIADNLGNTRVVFTSATQTPKESLANMETPNADFPNDGDIFKSSLSLFDHTDNPGTTYTYSNLVNGGYDGQIGIAKSYKVYPGDKVKIEAYAKYWHSTSGSSNVTGFVAAILSAFGAPTPGVGEVGTAAAGLNSYGGVVAAGNGPTSSGPKAFINILLFDKDHKFLEVAYEAIDPAALEDGSNKAFDYMSKEYTVEEMGYAYLYVSNENPTLVDVYFDDVKMTYTPGNVIQYNEYYPFGTRTAESWDRVDEKDMSWMTTDLVAKVSFDGDGNDTSGNGNNATIVGGTTTIGQGRPYAMALDGTDDYAQIADNATLDFGTGDFTIAIWIKKLAATSSSDNREVIHKWNNLGGPSTNEWMLATSSNGSDNKPTFYIGAGASNVTVSSSEELTIGQWYHLGVIRQGSDIKLYVNSILKATLNFGTGAINNSGLNMVIGKALSGIYTNAVYDDLYIYKRALTEDELRNLYLDRPELVNNYLYNSGSEFNTAASWYEMDFREYDPTLGRMNGVDPMAGKYSSITPYNYAFNMPTVMNDPGGADPITTAMWYETRAQQKVYEDRGAAYNGPYTSAFTIDASGALVRTGGGGGGAYNSGGGGWGYGTSSSASGFLDDALRSEYGGSWSSGGGSLFMSNDAAMAAGIGYQASITDQGIAEVLTQMYGGPNTNVSVQSGKATITNWVILNAAYSSNFGNMAGSGYVVESKSTMSFGNANAAGRGIINASVFPESFEYANLLLNAGTTLIGAGESGLTYMRQYPMGPRDIARGVSNLVGSRVGTQATARFLKNASQGAKNLGSKLGGLGAMLSTGDYILNGGEKNGYEHANYWIGMGVFALTALNPATAAIGLVYGAVQIGSYLYNGKTAEENIGKALGF